MRVRTAAKHFVTVRDCAECVALRHDLKAEQQRAERYERALREITQHHSPWVFDLKYIAAKALEQ